MPHLDPELGDAVVQQGEGAAIQGAVDDDLVGRAQQGQKVAAMAPMPELKATAASPFSRVAMRDSSRARVGLEIRV